ncbi:hypothetical protein BGX38DRAFT_1173630 [Terfezia claveryi]|nr:hypothetical protein BGX38DRAFT_1173630 [Terfezia claveryi]
MGGLRERFRLHSRSSSAPQPEIPQIKQTKIGASEHLAIMLSLPATVTMLPTVPAATQVVGRWMGMINSLKRAAMNQDERQSLFNPNSVTSLSDTLQETRDILEQFQKEQWKIERKDTDGNTTQEAVTEIIARACVRINQYTPIVDMMVQHNPFMTSLVWGSVKAILKIATSDANMISKLAGLIHDYIEASEAYLTYWKMYKHSHASSGRKILEILKALEEDIQRFTHAARRFFYTKHAVVRISKVAFTPFEVELQPICDGIKDRGIRLERAVHAATLDEQRRLEVLTWLSAIPYRDSHVNACEKRMENTCGWLFDREEFQNWQTEETSSLLWVHGKPGFGKTLLMSKVVEHIMHETHREHVPHVGYMYCSINRPETLEAVNILATILKQLISYLPDIPDNILSTFHTHKYQGLTSGLGRHRLIDIQNGLREVLEVYGSAHSPQPIYILLDGLDECGKDARAMVITALRYMISPTSNSPLPGPSAIAKIAIFSRPERDVRLALGNGGWSFSEISIQSADTTADIKTFLTGKVKGSRLLFVDEKAIGVHVIDHLVKNANGMFLWVSLQQDRIFRELDITTIRKYLKDLPDSSNMDESYGRMLTEISQETTGNKRLAEETLRWALFATRPLSVAELCDVLSFSGLVSAKDTKKKILSDVISVCHGLLEVSKQGDGNVCRFVHFSAKEFTMRLFEGTNAAFNPNDLPPTESNPKLGPVSYDRKIALVCINYLCQEHFRAGPWSVNGLYDCRENYEALLKSHPFFAYAALSWPKHLSTTQTPDFSDSELRTAVTTLFHRPMNVGLAFQVYWFETFVDRFPAGFTPFHIACYFGFVEILNPRKGDKRMFSTDAQGHTPFYWAAVNGHGKVLEILGLIGGGHIDGSPRLTDNGGQPKESMGGDGRRTSFMDKRQALEEALLGALEGNQIDIIQRLLAAGADPNRKNPQDCKDPLFVASSKGSLEAVQLLVEAGAEVNHHDINQQSDTLFESPLIAAVQAGAVDVARYLLSVGADVNAKASSGHTPLHAAVFARHHGIVRLFLAEGADLMPEVADGQGIFECASMLSDHKMLEILVEEAHRRGLDLGIQEAAWADISQGVINKSNQATPKASGKKPKTHEKAVSVILRMGASVVKSTTGNFGTPRNLEPFKKMTREGLVFLARLFENEELGVIDAALDALPKVFDDCLREASSGFSSEVMDIVFDFVEGVFFYIALNIKTEKHLIMGEGCRAMGGLLLTTALEGGYMGFIRGRIVFTHKNIIDCVLNGKQEDIENSFIRIAAIADIAVMVMDNPLTLRGFVFCYLEGLSTVEKKDPTRAHLLLKTFLADVGMKGLDAGRNGPEKRKLIIVIEMGYAARAYGHKQVSGAIVVKVTGILSLLKGQRQFEVDELMQSQLQGLLNGGSSNWRWDDHELAWWHANKDLNKFRDVYFGL